MATSEAQTFRIPFLLLAVANLAALGTLLWPWQEAINLPPNGTTAVDPAVILLAYLGLIYWVPNGIQEQTRKALSLGATIGILAGLILVARVMVGVRMPVEPIWLQPSLLGVAVILWGVAGLRGSRAAGNAGVGALAGLWSAMVSGLMGCAAIFAELYLAGPTAASPDPWKQYQGLAIGNTVTQGLVHSLNSATGLLLLGPLAGAAIGLMFALLGQNSKS
jgi:hypothetical protein